MSYYKTRKRRRSQAFANDLNEVEQDDNGLAGSGVEEHADTSSVGNNVLLTEAPSEEREMAHESWDAFKEEHHEVLEQLPLSLHRQYTLMRELDEQTQGESSGSCITLLSVHSALSLAHNSELLNTIQRYIALRFTLVARSELSTGDNGPIVADPASLVDPDRDAVDVSGGPSLHPHSSSGSPPMRPLSEAADVESVVSAPDKSANHLLPDSGPVLRTERDEPSESTRQLLQSIATMSEEVLRSSEEKVNLAQTAYETVERHVRLLDQAIKEQEASISLGVRPGTHLAPILLPDLSVPRWGRPPRVEYSPVPSISPEPQPKFPSAVEEPVDEESAPNGLVEGTSNVKRKKSATKAKKAALPKRVDPPEELGELQRTRPARAVKLTIPAQHLRQPPVAPNEPRYCYCNQVSYGVLIGCDNSDCKLEWFHLGCTGLSEVPNKKTKWYCRDCQPKMAHKGKQK
ncbi:hypothetical protein BV22DRAFT_1031467 [Leucogyrophana mollusca]|uniref:Uncharacterized protein n=1 Tax=Leucogyrophana mollusca TaxID=85980 RepID=A0ACB8BS28_9AGAM|nr:hypothetical protein BV22DRAFT_1031467 [Leucogyrophana mollusca]